MKLIPNPNVSDTRVMGRDIFTRTKKKKAGEDVTTVNLPLRWFTPKAAGSGISFGPGISYQTGEEPTGMGTVFGSGQRICLVETMLPSVAFNIVNEYGEFDVFGDTWEYKLQSLSITDVDRTAEIQVIPIPYHSTPGVIRQDGNCDPEIRFTVLGYRDVVRGLAIAEKVITRRVDPDFPDTTHINRYPYFIPNYGTPDYNQPLLPGADEYYYTEKELEDAGGVTP
jgi:hypothetical protein